MNKNDSGRTDQALDDFAVVDIGKNNTFKVKKATQEYVTNLKIKQRKTSPLNDILGVSILV